MDFGIPDCLGVVPQADVPPIHITNYGGFDLDLPCLSLTLITALMKWRIINQHTSRRTKFFQGCRLFKVIPLNLSKSIDKACGSDPDVGPSV